MLELVVVILSVLSSYSDLLRYIVVLQEANKQCDVAQASTKFKMSTVVNIVDKALLVSYTANFLM